MYPTQQQSGNLLTFSARWQLFFTGEQNYLNEISLQEKLSTRLDHQICQVKSSSQPAHLLSTRLLMNLLSIVPVRA